MIHTISVDLDPSGPVPVVVGLTTTACPTHAPGPLRPCAGGSGFDNYKYRRATSPFPLRPRAGGSGFDNYKYRRATTPFPLRPRAGGSGFDN